ncbi:unnamed protein product [Discosporangium mesarthrocarpum]
MFNVIHIDETWFYLMVYGQKVRVFAVEDMPGAPKLQHKSHVPKFMFIVCGKWAPQSGQKL